MVAATLFDAVSLAQSSEDLLGAPKEPSESEQDGISWGDTRQGVQYGVRMFIPKDLSGTKETREELFPIDTVRAEVCCRNVGKATRSTRVPQPDDLFFVATRHDGRPCRVKHSALWREPEGERHLRLQPGETATLGWLVLCVTPNGMQDNSFDDVLTEPGRVAIGVEGKPQSDFADLKLGTKGFRVLEEKEHREFELQFVGADNGEPLPGLQVHVTCAGRLGNRDYVDVPTTDAEGVITTKAAVREDSMVFFRLSSDTATRYLAVEETNRGASHLNGKSRLGHVKITERGVTYTANETTVFDEQLAAETTPSKPRIVVRLLPACRLTLRVLDIETGKGIPGATFMREGTVGEISESTIADHNIGAAVSQKLRSDRTDERGELTVWATPDPVLAFAKGYRPVKEEYPGFTYGDQEAKYVFWFKKRGN